MARRRSDPLDCIPSPDPIREKLRETETLAERLRLLLYVAERINSTVNPGDTLTTPKLGEAVSA